jgi:WD40 repeat protein
MWGVQSIALQFHQIASTLSQALETKQFVCGMPLQERWWQAHLLVTQSSVWSVAFSPDGQHIVSGSDDKTICVWNATTGEIVAGPFTGHTVQSMSVAFSPDGQHIVSGSDDKTICVWNATTGEIVAGPFTGHTDSVWSVAFSPDGQHIVSGSDDKTICVWNATTGEIVAGPFTGHTIQSVCGILTRWPAHCLRL